VETKDGLALCEEVYKPYNGDNSLVGSTDVGSVSWVVPTVQMRGATCAIGTPLHSWQMVAQGKLPAAHKGMAHAAKIMSSTAAELFRNPEHITAAKADHKKRLGGTVFINPIPDDVQPALPEQKA
jgi:aminobenzoyl-glutamate utilization protein B